MHNKLTEKEIWDLILKNKALIYKYIYKYTKNDVDDIWQDVVIDVYRRLKKYDQKYSITVLINSSIKDVLIKRNKYSTRFVIVDEDTIDYVMTGGVAV